MENFKRRKAKTFNWSETYTLPPTSTSTIPNCKLKPSLQNSGYHPHHHQIVEDDDHPKISKRTRWNFGESGKTILFLLLSVFLTGKRFFFISFCIRKLPNKNGIKIFQKKKLAQLKCHLGHT